MRRVGLDVDSKERWQSVAKNYADTIDGAYHRQRLRAIQALLPDLQGKTVIDFGCGEGVLLEVAGSLAAGRLVGLDTEPSLLELAKQRVSAEYVLGGVERLREFNRCDCLIAANVLAYMTAKEEAAFYREAQRLTKHLVVTHSNSLFDLFTLNAYTVDFFRSNFGVDPSGLLINPDKPNRVTFNVRENPLAYPDKLARYGFKVERTEFMNLHTVQPLLSNEDPDDMQRERPDPNSVDRWKRMFQCSMFGVLASR